MKKHLIFGLAFVSSAAWASHTPEQNPNASNNGCGGQARSVFVQMLDPGGFGAIASSIKGNMSYEQHILRAYCVH